MGLWMLAEAESDEEISADWPISVGGVQRGGDCVGGEIGSDSGLQVARNLDIACVTERVGADPIDAGDGEFVFVDQLGTCGDEIPLADRHHRFDEI